MGMSGRVALVFAALALHQSEAELVLSHPSLLSPAGARGDGDEDEEANCLLQARAASKPQDNDAIKQNEPMKLKRLEAYFHPSVPGWAPKQSSKTAAAIKDFVQAYADALANVASDQGASWLALWDHAGNVTLSDPVGTPVVNNIDGIAAFAKTIPPLSGVKVKDVFFSGDDNIFLASLQLSLNGATFEILDLFTVNTGMKLTKLEAHWHPSVLGVAPKPVAIHEAMKSFVQGYANAFANHESDGGAGLLTQWSTTGDIAFFDPVGMPVFDSFPALKQQFKRLPPVSSVTVGDVFFSADDKIFCAILLVTVQNGPTVPVAERYFFV